MNEKLPGVSHAQIRVVHAQAMRDTDWADLYEVFDASYRQADHPYLEKSVQRIGLLALAVLDGAPSGFVVSNFRRLDLPGFDAPQVVMLHGMRCVSPSARHRGLAENMSDALATEMKRGIAATGGPARRELHCGRHGHASRASGRSDAGAVPRPGRTPSDWQKAVGLKVAEAYGSNLDPTTFVCVGSGTPIGYPNEAFQATETERVAFDAVNRTRGDNLLVMSWTPDPPPGWVVA